MGRLLRNLVWVLGLWQVRHKALVLAVEVDEDESRQDESATHAVAAESGRRACQ